MEGFLLFLFILAVVVVANLVKKSNASTASRRQRLRSPAAWNFQQARRGLESIRGTQGSGSSAGAWPAPNIPAAVPADPRRATPPPPSGPPAEQTTSHAWQAAWAPADAPVAGATPAMNPGIQVPAPERVALAGVGDVVEQTGTGITDLRDDPPVRAFLPEPGAFDIPTSEPASSSARSEPPNDRYVGSAALESTLDSTIESSLLGMPDSPTMAYVATGGRRMDLADDVAADVVTFLGRGHEVAAVRLICDTTDCGILDAMRTVESYR